MVKKSDLPLLVLMLVAAFLLGTLPCMSMAAQEKAATPPAQAPMGTMAPGHAGHEMVNINTASVAQLEQLPGIGPKMAEEIVKHREAKGPFKSVDEVKNVKGIGDQKFEAVKGMITVK